MKRVLAVDYGLSRVGLALSDPLGLTAQPFATLERRGDRQICRELAQLVEHEDVGEVVVGLPLELSGKHGPAALAVEAFAERLTRHVRVPIHFWDERLTSVAAERAMGGAPKGRKARKKREKVIDQVAASLILQGFLASRPPPMWEEAADEEMEE